MKDPTRREATRPSDSEMIALGEAPLDPVLDGLDELDGRGTPAVPEEVADPPEDEPSKIRSAAVSGTR